MAKIKKRNPPEKPLDWLLLIIFMFIVGFIVWNFDLGVYNFGERRAPIFPVNTPLGLISFLLLIGF